jgi:hypothetical protein
MKKITKNIYAALLAPLGLSLLLTSCYKDFDPKSYAPAFTINGYTSASEIAKANLVGYWAFDSNLIDSVSNAAGTNTGTSFVNGFKGKAIQGGLNSYVLADANANINAMTSFSLSFWVNTPPPSTGIIGLFALSKTDAFWGNIELFFENGSTNSAGKFRTHLFNGTTDKEFPSNDIVGFFDKWVSITITYDGAASIYKLYVNGSNVSTVNGAGFGPLKITSPGKIVFGAPQFMTTPSLTNSHGAEPWASFLTGQLDEVRLYNKVLTAEEINALVVLQGKGK